MTSSALGVGKLPPKLDAVLDLDEAEVDAVVESYEHVYRPEKS